MEKNWEIKEPIEFFAEASYYLINGIKYYRVTQIKGVLSQPGLTNWFKYNDGKEIDKIIRERQTLGTKIHKLFELKLQGNKINADNYEEEVKEDLKLFDEICEKCDIIPEALEQHLWNEKYEIAGTADLICKYKSCEEFLPTEGRGKNKKHVNGKFNKSSRVIGDWKSSPSIYNDYWLQIAAYLFMFEKLTDDKLDGAFIAQFRNGKVNIEEKTREELLAYWEVFKHLIEAFRFKHNVFECKVIEWN